MDIRYINLDMDTAQDLDKTAQDLEMWCECDEGLVLEDL